MSINRPILPEPKCDGNSCHLVAIINIYSRLWQKSFIKICLVFFIIILLFFIFSFTILHQIISCVLILWFNSKSTNWWIFFLFRIFLCHLSFRSSSSSFHILIDRWKRWCDWYVCIFFLKIQHCWIEWMNQSFFFGMYIIYESVQFSVHSTFFPSLLKHVNTNTLNSPFFLLSLSLSLGLLTVRFSSFSNHFTKPKPVCCFNALMCFTKVLSYLYIY